MKPIACQIKLVLVLTLVTCNLLSAQNTSRKYTIVTTRDSVIIEPETESFAMTKGSIAVRVDLNNDGIQDLIVSFGNCGNWGDCIFGFFIADKTQLYRCVFEEYLPPFKIAQTTTTLDHVNWKDITVTDRTHDKQGNPVTVTKRMFFNGEVYTVK